MPRRYCRLVPVSPARRWRSQRVCFLPGEIPCGCRSRWFWLFSLQEHQFASLRTCIAFFSESDPAPCALPFSSSQGPVRKKQRGRGSQRPVENELTPAQIHTVSTCFRHTERCLPSFFPNLTSVPLQAWAIWSRSGEVTMSWPMTAYHW